MTGYVEQSSEKVKNTELKKKTNKQTNQQLLNDQVW